MKSTRHARSHNEALLAFIETIKSDSSHAKTRDDIETIAKKIEEYATTSKLKFNHAKAWFVALSCEVTAAIMWVPGGQIYVNGYPLKGNIYYLVTIGVLVIAGLVWLIKSYASKRHIMKEASDHLLFKSHLIHHGLTRPGFSGISLWQTLRSRFLGFHRGDESRYIDRYYEGQYDLNEIHIDYALFRFHYVVVTEVQVTTYNAVTKKNETKTEERRSTYYRHGLTMDFPYAKGFCISADGCTYPEEWSTSSERFNDMFDDITADDPLTCAKVLQPSVVLELTDKMAGLKRMTLEVNRNLLLCLSCNNSHLLPFCEDIMLNHTEKYLDALRHPATNTTLMRTLHGLGMMVKFNDKNFT